MKTPLEKLIDFISADALTAEEADFVIVSLLHLRQLRKLGMRPQFFRFYYSHNAMSETIPVPQTAAEIEAAEREAEKAAAEREKRIAERAERQKASEERPRGKK